MLGDRIHEHGLQQRIDAAMRYKEALNDAQTNRLDVRTELDRPVGNGLQVLFVLYAVLNGIAVGGLGVELFWSTIIRRIY